MPCRCDDYVHEGNVTGAAYSNLSKEKETLHMELCRARAIIMKMRNEADGKSVWSEDIERKSKNEVTLLLAHKREEIQKDIRQIKRDVSAIENRITTIKNMGGEPTKGLMLELAARIKQLHNAQDMTDAEILGT